MQGKFITFEGIDFSGKSLQARLLCEALSQKGLAVELFRDPGATRISEGIRAIVLDGENAEMHRHTELLLYAAARTQMVAELIRPALGAGKIVICDRFYDSTTAYQGYGREINLEFIQKLNSFVTSNLRPDLTFLIDISLDVAVERNRASGGTQDRIEKETHEFHQRVREGYLQLARSSNERDRFEIIDGAQSIENIQTQILEIVRKKLTLSDISW